MGSRRMNRALPMGSGPRPINNGLDLQTRDAQKRAMEMAMKTQLLEIAAPIYGDLINRFVHAHAVEHAVVDHSQLRRLAGISWRASLYLLEAAGMLQINDEELWKDQKPESAAATVPEEPRGY